MKVMAACTVVRTVASPHSLVSAHVSLCKIRRFNLLGQKWMRATWWNPRCCTEKLQLAQRKRPCRLNKNCASVTAHGLSLNSEAACSCAFCLANSRCCSFRAFSSSSFGSDSDGGQEHHSSTCLLLLPLFCLFCFPGDHWTCNDPTMIPGPRVLSRSNSSFFSCCRLAACTASAKPKDSQQTPTELTVSVNSRNWPTSAAAFASQGQIRPRLMTTRGRFTAQHHVSMSVGCFLEALDLGCLPTVVWKFSHRLA